MMLEVFRGHEKRVAEEPKSGERGPQHLPHRTPNPLPRHSGRIGPSAPSSKMPGLHHPPSLPMQLASNVMVVPPQQIAASTSQQLFLSSNHSRRRLAVAHPIMRQNPSYTPSFAHDLAKAHPQRDKGTPSGTRSTSQDSPLDLSAPLDLSVKRKKVPVPEDLFQQSASKKLKFLDSANRRGSGQQLAGEVPGILSKPPPIYPGLHRSEQHRLMRQQRKVHPMVQTSQSNDPPIPPKHFRPQVPMSKEEEVKLRFARRAFAMQSSMLLHSKNVPPNEPQLPVKRVQAAVPPLVTSSTSGPAWPQRDQVLPSIAQRVSDHQREKRLLAQAAAMGIPVDHESSTGGAALQRTPQLIKENGSVDAEMEEALRKMMQRSHQQRHSPKTASSLEHAAIAELKKRQAYNEYMSKQILLHSLQQQTQQMACLQERSPSAGSPHMSMTRPHEPRPSTSSSPHLSLARPHEPRPSSSASPHVPLALPHEPRPSSSASPHIPLARPHELRPPSSASPHIPLARHHEPRQSSSVSPHPPPRHLSPKREKPDILKRRYLYELPTGYHPPGLPSSPPVLEAIDSKMKLVQGVGTNSGPQYRLSLKDLDQRQNRPSLIRHEKHKPEPRQMRTYQYRAPDTKAKRVRDYLQEYNKIFGDRFERATSPQDVLGSLTDRVAPSKDSQNRQVDPTGAPSFGVTASRGPISQGLPHPISKRGVPPSIQPDSNHQRATPPVLTSSEARPSGDRKDPSSASCETGGIRSRTAAGVPFHGDVRPSTSSNDSSNSHKGRGLLDPEAARNQIMAAINPAFSRILPDCTNQSPMMLHSLSGRNRGYRHSKGFALNIKEVIAREISKCIDEEFPKASDVIDLTNESSEGSSTPPEGAGRVGSPQAILPAPVVIENLKQGTTTIQEPPPLIKASELPPSGFVPLVSNSVITSGTVSTSSQPFAAPIKKFGSPEEPPKKILPVEVKTEVSSRVKPDPDQRACVAEKRDSCRKVLRDMAERKNKELVECQSTDSSTVEKKPRMEGILKSKGVHESGGTPKCRRVIKGEQSGKRRKALKTVEDFINEATLRNMGDFEFTDEDDTTVGIMDCKKMRKPLLQCSKVNVSPTMGKTSPTEPSASSAATMKSVSYDPRRKVLAALCEQERQPPNDEKEMSDHGAASAEEGVPRNNYPDTKIVARADRDDEDCKLPDQLLEDDDDDDSSTEVIPAAAVAETCPEEKPTVGAVTDLPQKTLEELETEQSEPEPEEITEGQMTPKPRRKRRRRVRRYYHIIPRRASARRGTKRRPPQTRRSPSSTSKPKSEDASPPLQVRTRNSDGRRRLAAMASTYHRDTRYEQEIEKEERKVMERRQRRRRAVVRAQGSSASEGGTSPEADPAMDGVRRRRCKAVTSYFTEIKRTSGQMVASHTDSEYGVLGQHMELKVRIQRKNLTGKFQGRGEEDGWQVVTEGDRLPAAQKPKACRSMTFQEESSPSNPAMLHHKRLKMGAKRKKRRGKRITAVRRRLLETRVLLDDTRPIAPPVPKELKRLAVNKKLGETLLHKAARLGHDEAALYYINYCTQDLNAKDNAGYTPLHECSVNGRLKVAKHMIAKGADVNGSAADGTRPVHDAIDNEKVELARLLLAHGGDPLIATYSGRTTRKLARSQETKALVYGYLRDINGRLLAADEELDDLQKVNFNIRFHSSVQSAEDITNSGADFMSGAPSVGPDEDLMFELSDEPMLPSISMYLEEPKKYSNWLLLTDVLQRLSLTRADFMYSHRDVSIYSIKKQQLHTAALGQSHAKAAMTKCPGKTLEFVELNDHIRRILGTEVDYVR